MTPRFPFPAWALALALAPTVQAQALLQPPPPPPSQLEQQLAGINSVPKLLAMGEQFDQQGDWLSYTKTMERVLLLRPYAGTARYELAAGHAMQNEKQQAYDNLLKLKDAGWYFDLPADARFKNAQGNKVWDYIVSNLEGNAKPYGPGKLAFELPGEDLLVEALAWDPTRKALLVGSTREGRIMRREASGKLVDFIKPSEQNSLWSVLDMAVDAERGLLWVASTALPHFKAAKPEDLGRSGVFKFDLASGKYLGRYLLNGAHVLTAIALAADGQVFAAEGAARAIYRLQDEKLVLALANPKLTDVRGIATNAAGTVLYLADYELGVFGVELASGTAFQLMGARSLSQFGIDGLYWFDGTLVAIQNGMTPRRVLRMRLSEDGRRVVASTIVDAAKPEFDAPTRGTIVDDKLLFIANNQRANYDGYGLPRDKGKLAPTRVFESNLRFDWSDGPKLPKALEQRKPQG